MVIQRAQPTCNKSTLGIIRTHHLGVDGLDQSLRELYLVLQPQLDAFDTTRSVLVARDRVSRVLQIPGEGVDALDSGGRMSRSCCSFTEAVLGSWRGTPADPRGAEAGGTGMQARLEGLAAAGPGNPGLHSACLVKAQARGCRKEPWGSGPQLWWTGVAGGPGPSASTLASIEAA